MHRARVRYLGWAAPAAAILALVPVVAAPAASPLPKGGAAYSTGAGKHQVSLTFVTSVRDPKQILEGAAALGSQYAMSGGSLQCPKAKKSKGSHGTPFVPFGFPGAELKPVNGAYGFAKTDKEPMTSALGSSAKPFTLKVKITGSVVTPTKIVGTVKASGGPCKTKKPLKYTAKLDPKLPVAPQ